MAVRKGTQYSDTSIAEVREQLERVLAHPLFRRSERYPLFLRYVVEQTLVGNADQLKERSIGIDVFERSPDYDASADPVVRITAAEVRKRLAQYYYTAPPEELRIEIATGSYVPQFQQVSIDSVDTSSPTLPSEGPFPEPTNVTGIEIEQVLPKKAWLNKRFLYSFALLIPVLVLAGLHLRRQAVSRNQIENQFWEPMLGNPARVTLCITEYNISELRPQNMTDGTPESVAHHYITAPTIPLAVTVSLVRITSMLDRQHKRYRIVVPSQTSFDQLQEGPFVMIGGWNNPWVQRLTQDLRFGIYLSRDSNVASVFDRKSTRSWSIDMSQSFRDLTKSYAIVARFHDKTTGQSVVLISGLGPDGLEAASEFFSRPEALAGLLQNAPKNWSKMNFEAVIETQMVTGRPGQPNAIATEYW